MNIVYRDLDQAGVGLSVQQPGAGSRSEALSRLVHTASAAARARVAHVRDIAYGPCRMSGWIFSARRANRNDRRPVVVFVHGGAWRHLDLTRSALRPRPSPRAALCLSPSGFRECRRRGRLMKWLQVRAALAWLWQHIEAHGGDRERMHLIGHSSGAHLGAMVMTTEWPRLFGIPAVLVRSAVLVSGIYDLEPVRLSYRNEILKLDRAAEMRNSPCRNLPADGRAVAHRLRRVRYRRVQTASASVRGGLAASIRKLQGDGN